MAATVYLSESNGAVEAVTDNIANINFGSFDGPNMIPAQHAIVAGNYSTAKWLRIKLQALGGSTNISNITGWKSSGAYVTGEVIGGSFANVLYPGWAIPTYGHATNGNGGGAVTIPYTANGTTILSGTFNSYAVPTALPGSPNVTFASGTTFTVSVAGNYSDYLVFGMGTTGLTPNGPVNTKVFTIQYTET
jgi:hypothetical protein